MKETNDKLWKAVLIEMKSKVSQANFHTLFKNTHLISLEDNIATIAVPSTMIIDLLQKRHGADIKQLLSDKKGAEVDLIFIPLFSYTPGYALVKSCHLTKIGPNAPKDVTFPPGCQNASGGNQQVLELAKQQLGKQYRWGWPQPRVWSSWDPASKVPPNFDCSGLVGWSWYWGTGGKVNFPASTGATWNNMPPDKFVQHGPADKAQIQPGDAIYWGVKNIHHTALYMGPGPCPSNNCIIEAQQTGKPVLISDFETRILGNGNPWTGFIHPIGY